jgi:formamidopyrimidine-DNA glycosylase
MPELPEVEVIVRELRQKVLNEEIVDIKVHWPKSLVANGITRRSACSAIRAVRRYGKFIIFQLDHLDMLVHLRMTGRLIVSNKQKFDKAQLRVHFRFKSGKSLLFYDTRKFGRVYLATDADRFLESLGVDALNAQFSSKNFKALLRNKTGTIKPFLLDQRQLAGLGNIYADESLFRAGIHPQRQISSMSEKEQERLYRAIRRILQKAIKNMGTTLADYRTTGGESGRNQNYLKVYGREQNPCVRCKNPVEKKWIGGRGTHYCPVCQPLKTART